MTLTFFPWKLFDGGIYSVAVRIVCLFSVSVRIVCLFSVSVRKVCLFWSMVQVVWIGCWPQLNSSRRFFFAFTKINITMAWIFDVMLIQAVFIVKIFAKSIVHTKEGKFGLLYSIFPSRTGENAPYLLAKVPKCQAYFVR